MSKWQVGREFPFEVWVFSHGVLFSLTAVDDVDASEGRDISHGSLFARWEFPF